MKITDGTGAGYEARVGSTNRLYVDGVTSSRYAYASATGASFNINTGPVVLTSANKSAVLYVRNNNDQAMVIETLFYLLGNSTGGSGHVYVTVWRNPTVGTIISQETEAEMAGVNRNFGSSKSFVGPIYKGFEGATLTDGSKCIETLLTQTPQRVVLATGDIVVPKGASFGITVTPATGNTSFTLEIAASFYLDSLEV